MQKGKGKRLREGRGGDRGGPPSIYCKCNRATVQPQQPLEIGGGRIELSLSTTGGNYAADAMHRNGRLSLDCPFNRLSRPRPFRFKWSTMRIIVVGISPNKLACRAYQDTERAAIYLSLVSLSRHSPHLYHSSLHCPTKFMPKFVPRVIRRSIFQRISSTHRPITKRNEGMLCGHAH